MSNFEERENKFEKVELNSKEQAIEALGIGITLLLLVGSFLKILFF